MDIFKSIVFTFGQGFCFYILLPLWYVSIKLFDILKGNKHYGN